MTKIVWEMTHSVETSASLVFAWDFWTDVTNWDDPPAKFALDGPFAVGTRGTAQIPGEELLHWLIREATCPNAATIETQLDGAALSFAWRFEGLTDGRTRLTQRVLLKGEKADVYLSQVKSTFMASLAAGMNKLAAAMANAYSSRFR
jgi:hypothetical protein